MRPSLFALTLAAFFLFACEAEVTEPLPTTVDVFVANSYTQVPATLSVIPQSALERLVATLGEPTATVSLQPGLSWPDGLAFTALQFRLGINWPAAYDPDVLDRVEVLDDFTFWFYFKTKPGIANWQYGALLAPIVNRGYWQPRFRDALNLRKFRSRFSGLAFRRLPVLSV